MKMPLPFRPKIRIEMNSGYCGGAQWMSRIRNQKKDVYGGNGCVRNTSLHQVLRHYWAYLLRCNRPLMRRDGTAYLPADFKDIRV